MSDGLGGDKLQNPFDGGGGQDFLGFTASTPRGSPGGGRGFRPRHGKHNRRDSWQRFGEYEANRGNSWNPPPQHQHQQPPPAPGPYFYSPTQNMPPYRGSSRGSPWRGGGGGPPYPPYPRGGGFRPRGAPGTWSSPNNRFPSRGGRGRGFRYQDRGNASTEDYYHDSMLKNPWAKLEATAGLHSGEVTLAERSDHDAPDLSDSLIAQAGDSLLGRRLDPAPDVTEAEDASFASASGQEDHDEQDGRNLSDSMIPLVGDSIMQTSIVTEDE